MHDLRTTEAASKADRARTAALSSQTPAVKPQDTLGCSAGHLARDMELGVEGVRIYRKTTTAVQPGLVETPASGRGVLLGVSLASGHRRRILHEHHASTHDFQKGSIYIRDFGERYRAEMKSPFDFLLVEFSHAALERTFDGRGDASQLAARRVAGERDEVLQNLALALVPALERPAEASALFIDQLAAAMATYLMEQYGDVGAPSPRMRRILSRSQEARAKEMLRSKMDGSISVTEIADACQLSRSYFIHAFRQTTGQTPHQWLVAQRLARAQNLLTDFALPLAQVAADCGFSDQSHFTRVFSQHVGVPPGTWRRKVRAGQ